MDRAVRDAAGQVDSRGGVSPDQEDWRSALRSRIQVESRRLSSGLSGDYTDYPATARLIDKLVREKGFKRAYLERILARIKRQQWILNFVNRPKAK